MSKFQPQFSEALLVVLFIASAISLSLYFAFSGIWFFRLALFLFFVDWVLILIESLRNRFRDRTLILLMLILTPPLGVLLYILKLPNYTSE